MKRLVKGFRDIAEVFGRELQAVFGDMGAVLFFFMLPALYPIVYTLIYNPEVVEQIPVVVVDDSRTEASRHLVMTASASPSVAIAGYAASMAEAREAMAERKAYAVMHIDRDYGRNLGRSEQGWVDLYCDMSLLLRYRALLLATSDLQLYLASEATTRLFDMTGASMLTGGEASLPVESDSHFLGDSQQGFASFVIPGIVILILQQSMLLGIVMLGVTNRSRPTTAGCFATVMGKALCYVLLYVPGTIYVMHYIPVWFALPHSGSAADYLLLALPLLLATAFMGQALTAAVREREDVFLVLVFSSVVFLFLSGLSWPRYAMARGWQIIGGLLPSTWGVEGFIRINSNGATLADVAAPYTMLWVLVALYLTLALSVVHLRKTHPL